MKTKLLAIAGLALLFSFGFTACEEEEVPTYALTLTVSPENAGTVIGAGDYEEGEVVALTATATAGFLFVNWTNGTTVVSEDADYEYTTTAEDVTLTANFDAKNIAKLGAQDNVDFGSFLSVSEKAVYFQGPASENQDKIDILCFYEAETGNNIALAAPGSNITGIFEGASSPDFWTTKNQTYFTMPTSEITIEQFDALRDGDAAIETYYNAEQTTGNKKSKDLQVGNIRTFKTQSGTFGIYKVLSVEQGATGYVEFEYRLK